MVTFRLWILGLLPVLLGASFSLGEAETPESLLEKLPADMRENLVDPLSILKTPSFAGGETLQFKLGWSWFTVAKSKLTVEGDSWNNRDALKISINTRTNGFADAFYKVRNQSTSWVAPDLSRSFEYTALQEEGDRFRNTTALFDSEANQAQYINNRTGEERDAIGVMPGTFDPLGIVFFIRSLDFEVGDELIVPTSNGKEFFFTVVRVVDKVKRKFLIGKREAYVLEPDIKDIGGVFKRSPDGKIRFYFSADEEKLPLRMESEVAVGSFWAELDEVIEE